MSKEAFIRIIWLEIIHPDRKEKGRGLWSLTKREAPIPFTSACKICVLKEQWLTWGWGVRKLCVTEREMEVGVRVTGIDQTYGFQAPYLKSLSQT